MLHRPSTTWRGRVAIAAASAAFLAGSSASAQAPQGDAEREGLKLFQEGVAALKAGSGPLACQKFAESNAKNRSIGALLNLADCDAQAGKPLAAWRRANEAIELIKAKGDDRLKFATDQATALDAKVPRLTVKLPADAPAGARVTRDGEALAADALGAEARVEAGTYVFATQAAGREDGRDEVALAPGDRREVVLTLGAPRAIEAAKPAGPVAPEGPAAPEVASKGNPLRTAAWVALGVGAVGAVGAVVTSAMVSSRYGTWKDAPNQANEDATKSLFGVNAVCWGAGIVGLGVGIPLFVISGSSKSSTTAAASARAPVKPRASLNVGVGQLHVRGAF